MSSCPRCSYANSSTNSFNKRASNSKKWVIVAVVGIAGVLGIFLLLGNAHLLYTASTSDKVPASDSNPSTQADSTANQNPSSQSSFSDSAKSKLAELKQYALSKINEDRAKFGLEPVLLSDNTAAQAHAEDILAARKLSHWTTDGMKPYMRYTVYGGNYAVAQNAAWRYSEGNDKLGDFRLDLCKANDFFCYTAEIRQAIDTAENEMMYNDKECCNDGHRLNILDKHHTHVSIGLAYNTYEIAYIQNFEDQYVNWTSPITYDKDANKVDMAGKFIGGLKAYEVAIFYDPLPTKETYFQNSDRTSYDSGEEIAYVLPPGYVLTNSSIATIHSTRWNVDGAAFDLSFNIDDLTNKYGNGVYTITLIGSKEKEELVSMTNKSIFIKG